MNGIIQHSYKNASDDLGQHEADACNRQAVTAEWARQHPDVHCWLFRKGNVEFGMDPWRLIDSIDTDVDHGTIILWLENGSEISVDSEFVVYAQCRDMAIADLQGLMTGGYRPLPKTQFIQDTLLKALKVAYANLPMPDHTGDINVVPDPVHRVAAVSKPDIDNTCSCPIHMARRAAARAIAMVEGRTDG